MNRVETQPFCLRLGGQHTKLHLGNRAFPSPDNLGMFELTGCQNCEKIKLPSL